MEKYLTFKKHLIIVPVTGETLTVRLLFNPADGEVIHRLNRKELFDISELSANSDLKSFVENNNTEFFFIGYAQYVSSTNPYIDNESHTLKNGDTVLLVFPSKAFEDINKLIDKYCKIPFGFDMVFAHSKNGLCICFDVSKENEYTVTEIENIAINTELTDDEFMHFLDELDSLYIPKRGVFWIIDGELIAYPFDEKATDGVAKSGNTYNHKLLWEHIKPCNKPFDYYPRGRVDYNAKGIAIIYMNPHIDDELIFDIKKTFGITSEPIIRYDYSEHYKCYLDR